jgi:hypothetical protein
MQQTKKALNDYYLGILYGDGYLQENYYYFSTTRKHLADIVEEKLTSKNIKYNRYCRDYTGKEKANWEQLEIIEIRDKEFLEWLQLRKLFSEQAHDRIKCNSNFIRGYIETKATFFYYKQRNTDAWRISISGTENDIHYLYNYLSQDHGIKCSSITQRKEREDLNIVSQSFRFSIQNRKGVRDLTEWIDADFDITSFLKNKIISFQKWDTKKPFNMVKTYRNYKSATLAMAKELDVELKGIRGGGNVKPKPVYLWKDEKAIQEFEGWQGAFEWAKEKFDEIGMNPPTIAE